MKKLSLLLLPLAMISFAHAHDVETLEAATSPRLEAFRVLAQKTTRRWSDAIVSSAYKVKTITGTREGERPASKFERVIKWSLHRDYPITGDDGGYSFGTYSRGELTRDALSEVTAEFRYLFPSDDEKERAGSEELRAAILAASRAGLTVLIGGGAGNNTTAEIVVIVDFKNKEYVYLMGSNFGRDS